MATFAATASCGGDDDADSDTAGTTATEAPSGSPDTAGTTATEAPSGSPDTAGTTATEAPPDTAGTTATEAPSGSPIRLGAIGSYSGAYAQALGIAKPVMEAWAEAVNARGGIDGHPIELTIMDDEGDPAKGLQQVKALVEEHEVIAIVGDISNTDTTWAPYVEEQGIPVIGGSPFNPTFYTNPFFFPSGGDQISTTYGAIAYAVEEGKTNVGAMYCAEVPSCQVLTEVISRSAESLGASLTYSGAAQVTAPSYTANCLAAEEKGVDTIFLAFGAETIIKIAESCDVQGYSPLFASTSASAANVMLPTENLEGTISVQNNFPFLETDSPAAQEYISALEEFAPDVLTSENYGPTATYSWVAGKLFEAAAEAGDLGSNPTSEQLIAGLYALEGETLGGLAPPLTFNEGEPNSVPCYFLMRIEGGEFVAPNGLETSCMPPELHQEIIAAISGQ